jgi:hypothetical protein
MLRGESPFPRDNFWRDELSPEIYEINGVVGEKDIGNGRYVVMLFEKRTDTIIATVSGDPYTGAYKFKNIPYLFKGYYTISIDQRAPLVNSAISDLLTPTLPV